MVKAKRVKVAIQASSQDIAAAANIQDTHVFKDKSLQLRVSAAPSLSSDEQEDVWNLYETNMRALVEPSSFGWHPKSKRKELFHRDARFILVFAKDGSAEPAETATLVAFTMFRFERDEEEDLLYCYELQVSGTLRGSGIGSFLVEKLVAIGKHWGMMKIMLTVLKGNVAARKFYSKTGFRLDPSSPECESSGDDSSLKDDNGEQDSCDYEILSREL